MGIINGKSAGLDDILREVRELQESVTSLVDELVDRHETLVAAARRAVDTAADFEYKPGHDITTIDEDALEALRDLLP